jgi:hypothetical protein
MSSYLTVNYTPVSTPIALLAGGGAKEFLAEDVATGQQNVSTSGLVVETVNQSLVVMVSFTLPATRVGGPSSGYYEAWAQFLAWALMGGTFILAPNYPLSGKLYNCVAGDPTGNKIKRVGIGRYDLGFKFRILTDSSAPANAAEVMDSFWGLV